MVKLYEDKHTCKHQTGSILKYEGIWYRIENGFTIKIIVCPYCGGKLK